MAIGASKSKIAIISAVPTSESGGPVANIPGQGGVELHAMTLGLFRGAKEINFDEFVERWNRVNAQVGTLIADLTKRTFGKMDLDEVEVSIGVTGEGTIGIATAKGEASVVLKFKKTDRASH